MASQLISFPAGTKTFQSPAFPYSEEHKCEVALRNPRFKDYMHLAEAYRRLSRPSSALEPSHPPNSLVVHLIYVWPHQYEISENVKK